MTHTKSYSKSNVLSERFGKMKRGEHCKGCMHSTLLNESCVCLKLIWSDKNTLSSILPEEGCRHYTDKEEERIKSRNW